MNVVETGRYGGCARCRYELSEADDKRILAILQELKTIFMAESVSFSKLPMTVGESNNYEIQIFGARNPGHEFKVPAKER